MKLFLLPETGTVDTMSAWVKAAHDAVNCGEETSIDALLDLLVQVKFVKGEWVKSNEES